MNKDYFKHRIKTAIICDTQYKWNEVTREFGLSWDKDDKWSMYKENSAIIPEQNTYCSIDFYKAGSYELIDFDVVDLDKGTAFSANPPTNHFRATTPTPHVRTAQMTPKPPVKPSGDVIGVRVIKDFPNTDGFKVGTIITEYGAYKHKWKGIEFYKQSPDFFEYVYGYKKIFSGCKDIQT